jgi:ribosome-binding protein aMBF1 (putative translation factor)
LRLIEAGLKNAEARSDRCAMSKMRREGEAPMPAGRRKQHAPHPVDVHVGARVRERRMTLGMSQPKLAAVLGIAYQQLYKYEQAKTA